MMNTPQNLTLAYRLLTDGVDYKGYFKYLLEFGNNGIVRTEKDVFHRLMKNSFDAEIDAECFFNRKGIRWYPVKLRNNITNSEFIISSNKYMADISWHRTKSGSNVYTSWLGYNYSRHNSFNLLPCEVKWPAGRVEAGLRPRRQTVRPGAPR